MEPLMPTFGFLRCDIHLQLTLVLADPSLIDRLFLSPLHRRLLGGCANRSDVLGRIREGDRKLNFSIPFGGISF